MAKSKGVINKGQVCSNTGGSGTHFRAVGTDLQPQSALLFLELLRPNSSVRPEQKVYPEDDLWSRTRMEYILLEAKLGAFELKAS